MPRPRTTSDEAILRGTARVIGERGLGRLTLAAVADEVGLSPATLVQRFGSKRGLLLAFADQGDHASRRPFARAKEAADSPLAALHVALADLTTAVRTPEEMANHVGFLQLDLADPAFREHAATQVRTLREEIAGLLAEAVTAGELVAGTDPVRVARAVHVAYVGGLIAWGLAGEGPLTEALRAEVDHLLDPYRRN